MSLESIVERILKEAEGNKEKILQEARLQAAGMIQEAKKEAESISEGILREASVRLKSQKQKLIVNARLEKKKLLLAAKRKIIEDLFAKLRSELAVKGLKKEQVSQDKVHNVPEDMDFYLARLSSDYEPEVSQIIFG
jgi:V/A-type H+-transporting ATPase subunit E